MQIATRHTSFRLPGVTYGMCMSMHAFRHGGAVYLAVGYEAGHAAVWRLSAPGQPLMAAQLHKEAVMALTIDGSAAGAGYCLSLRPTVCFPSKMVLVNVISHAIVPTGLP